MTCQHSKGVVSFADEEEDQRACCLAFPLGIPDNIDLPKDHKTIVPNQVDTFVYTIKKL